MSGPTTRCEKLGVHSPGVVKLVMLCAARQSSRRSNKRASMTRQASAAMAATGALAAWLGAAFIVRRNEGFGAGDLAPFAFWCILYGLLLATTALVMLPRIARRSRPRRVSVGAATGVAVGVLFTAALALGMGPAILGFSFPILWLWAGGGAVGLGAAASANSEATAAPLRLWRGLAIGIGLLVGLAAVPWLLVLGDMYVWGRAEREIYLLPAAYEGPVFVLYGQTDAAPLLREDGARVLAIPPGGVLRTSDSLAEGWKDPQVFTVDVHGQRHAIDRDWAHRDTSGARVRTYWLGIRFTGTVDGRPQPSMRYEAFVVGPRARDSVYEARSEVVLDSLWTRYAR